MSDSYLLDHFFEPPSTRTNAVISVAPRCNPDKQNNMVTFECAPSTAHQIRGNPVKLEFGLEALLPEGVLCAAHSRPLFVTSFELPQDPAGADIWTAG